MHRSGTSAVVRLLNLLGCDLPASLMSPASDNPEGFWESRSIMDLNDEILESAGSAWDDWRAFDAGWYTSPIADEYRERAQTVLREEFGDSRLFVMKDPRTCRLLKFWVEAIAGFGAELRVLSPIRNPLEVAASLEERDGIDRSVGHLIWLRHVLDAEKESRDCRRAYLRYETFLAEVHTVIDKLGNALAVSWPRRLSVDAEMAIDEFISPHLYHHRKEDAELLTNPRLSRWIVSSFEILDRWCRGEIHPRDAAKLGQLRAALDAAAPAFSRALAESDGRIASINQTIAEKDARIEALDAAIAEHEWWIAGLERGVIQRDGRIDALRRAATERDRQIRELGDTIAGHDKRIKALGQAIVERDEHIDTLHRAATERDRRIRDLDDTIAGRDERIKVLDQAVAERDEQVQELRGAVTERNGRIEALGQAVVERDERIEGLHAAVRERDERIEERIKVLDQAIAERDEQVQELRGAVTERNGRIEALGRAVVERDGRIEGLHAVVRERDERADELDKIVAEHSRCVEALGRAVVERDGRIEGLHAVVRERDEELVQSVAEQDERNEEWRLALSERDRRIVVLNHDLAERDREIAKVYDSNSWKVTAPLRRLRPQALLAPVRKTHGAGNRAFRTFQGRVPPSSADPAEPVLRFGPYLAVSRAGLAVRASAEESESGNIPILFDPVFYLDSNEDVRNDGGNLLEHYLARGATEGRMPVGDVNPDELHPLIQDLHRLDPTSDEAAAFNRDAYRFLNPDLAELDDEALIEHYEAHGHAESRRCSLGSLVDLICDNPREIPLDFDPGEYVDLYPEDMGSFKDRPLDALQHYMRHGRWEHRPYSLRALEAVSSPGSDPSEGAPRSLASRKTGLSADGGQEHLDVQ